MTCCHVFSDKISLSRLGHWQMAPVSPCRPHRLGPCPVSFISDREQPVCSYPQAVIGRLSRALQVDFHMARCRTTALPCRSADGEAQRFNKRLQVTSMA